MSTASTASPTVVRSSSRRQQSYSAPANDRPHRASSNATRPPTTPTTDRRTNPRPQSMERQPSSSGPAQLANVARRDYETTNVARPPSSRRSSSRERSYAPAPPKRTDSTRRQSGRPSHSRNSSQVAAGAPPAANGTSAATPSRAPLQDPSSQAGAGGAKRRTTIPAQTGQYTLGKTIGAGSMGKVKLAKNLESGEQVRQAYHRFPMSAFMTHSN